MYDAALMDLTECSGQPNGGAKKASQVERFPLVTLKNPIQRLTARAANTIVRWASMESRLRW